MAVINAIDEPDTRFNSSYTPPDDYQIYASGTRNREHVVPESWFDDSLNYHNDAINVVWSNKRANESRGNLPYCMVVMNALSSVKDGVMIVGYRQVNECFMPLDEYKGDVARFVLYIYVKYKPYIKP